MASPEPAQEVIERLSTALEAISRILSKPKFDATALRAQIMSNAQTLTHMLLTLDNDEFPYKEEPQMAIITSNENGQIRATVVTLNTEKDHKVVRAHLQGSLADSDSEALLSLYEDSKNWIATTKAELAKNGWWH